MKKRLFSLLLAALMLLLCACAKTAPATEADEPEPETPAEVPEEIPAETVTRPPVSDTVFVDWSTLDSYTPFTPVGSRLSATPLTELSGAVGHGPLVPYLGASLYYTSSDYVAGSKWGLCTTDGCVVLDPVCADAYLLGWYDPQTNENVSLGIYALTMVAPEVYESDDWEQMPYSYERYALIAADGSWCTGFDYVGLSAGADSVLAILDAQSNACVCYDLAGNLRFDSRDFDWLDQLAEYQSYTLANGGVLTLRDGGHALLRDGALAPVKAEGFDYADTFYEGLAVATIYQSAGEGNTGSRCGYLDETTLDWALEPAYASAGRFYNGVAVVRVGGVSQAIDRTGKVLFTFGTGSCWLECSSYGAWYNFYNESTGATEYYTADFAPVVLEGRELAHIGPLFYTRTDTGLNVLIDGQTLFVSDMQYITAANEDLMICSNSESTRSVVMDLQGNERFSLNGYLWLLSDNVTGEYFLQGWEQGSSRSTLYDSAGHPLPSAVQNYAPSRGLFTAQDEVSAGLMDQDGNWILRLALDRTD